jgi:hypothetical protein
MNERDLAAFILPEQTEAKRHFYALDTAHTTPAAAAQVGLLGYPEVTRLPAGAGFMATPYSTFGEIVAPPADCNPDSHVGVTYPTTSSVDSHGLSGAGIGLPDTAAGPVWTPAVHLVGLVTHVDPKPQFLLGLKVEELARFLTANVL